MFRCILWIHTFIITFLLAVNVADAGQIYGVMTGGSTPNAAAARKVTIPTFDGGPVHTAWEINGTDYLYFDTYLPGDFPDSGTLECTIAWSSNDIGTLTEDACLEIIVFVYLDGCDPRGSNYCIEGTWTNATYTTPVVNNMIYYKTVTVTPGIADDEDTGECTSCTTTCQDHYAVIGIRQATAATGCVAPIDTVRIHNVTCTY